MLWAETWASKGRLAQVPANESRMFAPFFTEGMLTVIDDKGLFVDKCPISLIGVLFTFVLSLVSQMCQNILWKESFYFDIEGMQLH